MTQKTKSWAADLISRFGENQTAFALILITAVSLRVLNLGESLWFDEVLYSTRLAATNLSRLWQLILTDTPAPLYRVVLYGWNGLFGENELVVRLPSLMCGIGAILLTYAIGKQYGSAKMATLAALFLCLSPVQVWYSQEATSYAMATCLSLGAVFACQVLRSGAHGGYWYLIYGLVLWSAIFTHYFNAVFLLPLTVMALTGVPAARKRIIAINILLGILTVAAFAAKSKLGILMLDLPFLRPFTLFEWWMLFFNWFLHGNSIWTLSPYGARPADLLNSRLLLPCQIFFLFLLIRGLTTPRQGGYARSLELPLCLCSLPLTLFLLTLVGFNKMYVERYLVMALPFFAIGIARGAVGFSNVWLRRGCISATLVVAVVSYAMFLSKGDVWTVYKQNPDMRSAAAYLLAHKPSKEEVLFILPTGKADLAYYVKKQAYPGHPPVEDYNPAKLAHMFKTGKLKGIFLVHNRYWEGNFQALYRHLNSIPRLEEVKTRSFKGVDIYTFVPK